MGAVLFFCMPAQVWHYLLLAAELIAGILVAYVVGRYASHPTRERRVAAGVAVGLAALCAALFLVLGARAGVDMHFRSDSAGAVELSPLFAAYRWWAAHFVVGALLSGAGLVAYIVGRRLEAGLGAGNGALDGRSTRYALIVAGVGLVISTLGSILVVWCRTGAR